MKERVSYQIPKEMIHTLSQETVSIILEHLILTHVISLTRLRKTCRWLSYCASDEPFDDKRLKTIMENGTIEHTFSFSPNAGELISPRLTACQDRNGPMAWNILFFPAGNRSSEYMSCYVIPAGRSVYSELDEEYRDASWGTKKIRLTFDHFDKDDSWGVTNAFYCCNRDWGYREYVKKQSSRQMDDLTEISVRVHLYVDWIITCNKCREEALHKALNPS